MATKSFNDTIRKYNPYHDNRGRFASRSGHTVFSPGKDPNQRARSIANEKLRAEADGFYDPATGKASWAQPEAQKPKFEYKESKTTKEATDYARGVLGIKHADYKGLDIRAANDMNKSLAESFSLFPDLQQNFEFVGSMQTRNKLSLDYHMKKRLPDMMDTVRRLYPNKTDAEVQKIAEKSLKKVYSKRASGSTYAEACFGKGIKGIALNEKYAKDADVLVKSLQNDVKTKWHPVGTGSVKAVIDHEIGHQIDKLYGIGKDSAIKRRISLEASTGGAKLTLSRYAEKNSAEFVAEAWAEFRNNPSPRGPATMVGQKIMEYAKK